MDVNDDFSNNSSPEESCTPEELKNVARNVSLNLLPEKSKHKYEKRRNTTTKKTNMQKKKEIEMLIARYRTDIAALEKREEDLLRQSEILENMIPGVLVWYMGKAIQTSQDKPIPQHEIEADVRGKLEHLKSVLRELQLVVGLLKEEKKIMSKRIEELETCLADQPEIKMLRKRAVSFTPEVVDEEQEEYLQEHGSKDTNSAKHKVKSMKEALPKPTINKMQQYGKETEDLKTQGLEDQRMEFEELLQSENTDWKKVCQDLLKQISELSENLNNSSQQLKESEDYVKHLEAEYSILEKELKAKLPLLEKRTGTAISEAVGKKKGKRLEEELEEVKSKLESLKRSTTLSQTRRGMDTAEFRQRGKEMVDYMCQYMETLPERPVVSKVNPGYLRTLVPPEAPSDPEPWDDIMADVESKVMPGITHWQHPRFHAYFPAGNSYPSILGDMLSDIIGCIGFSWAASPACTELETIMLDWMAKAIDLPHTFLSDSKGGGVIQGSASECVLVCMLAARAEALRRLHNSDSTISSNEESRCEASHLPRLVAYCSNEAHSCVEKAAIISLVQLRILEPDDDNSLRGEILRKAIEEDEAKGLVPFFVTAIIGSTGSCSFDNLQELGPVAKQHGLWLHVDAAYAGCAMVCPELRHLMQGMEYADSFNTNPNKFFLVNFDCSLLWVKERTKLIKALTVDPLYLRHEHEEEVFDYRHWGIPLSRRFRSLKLWFVIRSFGISGLQEYIRNHIRLARRFEDHVLKDKRFEVLNDVRLGLVCFRLCSKGDNLTTDLLANINHSGKLHMIPARIKGKYIIRFCVVAQQACEADIDYAWSVISDFATELLTSPDLSPRILCGIPTTPEGRKLNRQFSFTRGVSQSEFKFSASLRSSLYDGATPIIMVDDDEDTNVFDEVFESARNKAQDPSTK